MKNSPIEIVSRLLEIHATRQALLQEETELLIRLQKAKEHTHPPVPLTFGNNVITWGNGQALVIKGKGYRFVQILYAAKRMRLKEETLDRLIWKSKLNHCNFKVFIHRLAEKLEQSQFPYRLLPVMSKPKIEQSGDKNKNDKPERVYIPAEMIGVKLHATKTC